MVGTAGFEPTTLCPPGRCATRLRYAPTCVAPALSAVRAAHYTRIGAHGQRLEAGTRGWGLGASTRLCSPFACEGGWGDASAARCCMGAAEPPPIPPFPAAARNRCAMLGEGVSAQPSSESMAPNRARVAPAFPSPESRVPSPEARGKRQEARGKRQELPPACGGRLTFCGAKSKQKRRAGHAPVRLLPNRSPALLAARGPAPTRTSMCSNMGAFPPRPAPMLGALYGALSHSTAHPCATAPLLRFIP